MKLITLIENTAETDKLQIENGVSFYIEQEGVPFLLDFGASEKFIKNAIKFGIDLTSLKFGVLSRNSETSAGGISKFLPLITKSNENFKIYTSREAANDYFINAGMFTSPDGLAKSGFAKYTDNLILFNAFQQPYLNGLGVNGVFFMTCEFFEPRYASPDKTSYIKRNGRLILETEFLADVFTVVFTKGSDNGCVIIAPCARAGLPNIIATVRENWRDVPITAIIAGFHCAGKSHKYMNCEPEYLDEVTFAIKQFPNVGQIYATHCTGLKAYAYLKDRLGSQLSYLRAGEMLEF